MRPGLWPDDIGRLPGGDNVTQLVREIPIIKNEGSFSVIYLTLSEYNSLDDYSESVPVKREFNDMGKIPALANPGERLIDMVIDEDTNQVLHCLII